MRAYGRTPPVIVMISCHTCVCYIRSSLVYSHSALEGKVCVKPGFDFTSTDVQFWKYV